MSSREQLARRIEAYLDGALDPEQTAAFERELVKPAVARALEQALARRGDILSRGTGDGPPPPSETARIERGDATALKASRPRLKAAAAKAPSPARRQPRPSALTAALYGASWIVRGPAMAFTAPGSRAALDGLASARFALGPLLTNWSTARATAGAIVDNRPVRAASKAVSLIAKARAFTARSPWLQQALRRIVR
jgi:anti-sigma factor RsiW